MTLRIIDRSANSDLDDTTLATGGTVVGDVRVIYDDTENLGDILLALEAGRTHLIRLLE